MFPFDDVIMKSEIIATLASQMAALLFKFSRVKLRPNWIMANIGLLILWRKQDSIHNPSKVT